MVYAIQPLLGIVGGHIAQGLAQGLLTRWGGIIRIASGQPGAGTIVAHLRRFFEALLPSKKVVLMRVRR